MKTKAMFVVLALLAIGIPVHILAQGKASPPGNPHSTWEANPPIWKIIEAGESVQWVDASNPRFAVYDPSTPDDPSDDVVLDKETGLVWERSPSADRVDLYDAHKHCIRTTSGNRMGWRLPTIQELTGLVEPAVLVPPHLPDGHPFLNIQPYWYWSATSRAAFTGHTYTLALHGVPQPPENGVGSAIASTLKQTWCVRGGQSYEVQ